MNSDQPQYTGTESSKSGNTVRATVLGVLAMLIGSVVYWQFTMLTNYQLGLVSIVCGALVGGAISFGSEKEDNMTLFIIGAVLGGFSVFIADALIFADVAEREGIGDLFGKNIVERAIAILPDLPSALEVMDWVFIAISAYEGFIIPKRLADAN